MPDTPERTANSFLAEPQMPMLWLRPPFCTMLTSRMPTRLHTVNCAPPAAPKRLNISFGTFSASAPHPPTALRPVGISSRENTMMSTLCNPSFTAAAAMPPSTM